MKTKIMMGLTFAILLLGSIGCGDKKSQRAREIQPYTIPGLGMTFVYVAPGSFQMGAKDGGDIGTEIRRVTITKGFWIGKFEVTEKEYQIIMGGNASHLKGSDKPVEMISWNDAMKFCQKLTEREHAVGRLPSNCKYYLPTETEWEYAARGGNKSRGYKYSGSNDINSVAWYSLNVNEKSHKVGTKSANELGIHDMSGNVAEFCDGRYGDISDGKASSYMRVIRGGSRFSCPKPSIWGDCLVTDRAGVLSDAEPALGFRVVRKEYNELEDKIRQLRENAVNNEVARLKLQKYDRLDFSKPGPPVSTKTNKITNKKYGISSIDRLIKNGRKWSYSGVPINKDLVEYHQKAAYYGNRVSKSFLTAILNSNKHHKLFNDTLFKLTREGASIGIKEDINVLIAFSKGNITPFVKKRLLTPLLSKKKLVYAGEKSLQARRNAYFKAVKAGYKAYAKAKGFK